MIRATFHVCRAARKRTARSAIDRGSRETIEQSSIQRPDWDPPPPPPPPAAPPAPAPHTPAPSPAPRTGSGRDTLPGRCGNSAVWSCCQGLLGVTSRHCRYVDPAGRGSPEPPHPDQLHHPTLKCCLTRLLPSWQADTSQPSRSRRGLPCRRGSEAAAGQEVPGCGSGQALDTHLVLALDADEPSTEKPPMPPATCAFRSRGGVQESAPRELAQGVSSLESHAPPFPEIRSKEWSGGEGRAGDRTGLAPRAPPAPPRGVTG
jgi:hypothetical protein